MLLSCSKEKDVTVDLPKWLQERITQDENEITSDPHSANALGAWIQYTFKDSHYYEYHNLLMSSFPKVYYYDGTEMNFALPIYTNYQNGKCCKKFVWKGKSYFED
jgi:hypothetical protein